MGPTTDGGAGAGAGADGAAASTAWFAREESSGGDESTDEEEADDDDGPEFKAGDWVMHTRFGKGRIVEMAGMPGEEEAVIDFAESGEKRLVLAYAPLIRA